MTKQNMMRWGLAGLIALHAAALHAVESADLDMHGFGTLGAVYHNTPGDAQYRRDISQSTSEAAISRRVSFSQDSMLGVQGTAHLDDSLDASVQVLSRLEANGTYEPRVSMGYAKYRMGDSFVRVGRMSIETYMKGDAAEVGFANLQVRQPIVIIPRTFNGMDAETTQSLGGGLLRLKGMTGHTVGKIANAGAANYDTAGSLGIGALLDYLQAGWTIRYALYSIKMKRELTELQPGGALATLLADPNIDPRLFNRLTMKGRRISSQVLALAYEDGAIQGETGYNLTTSHDWPTSRHFYATAGYRIEQVTPYVSYASSHYARQFVSAYPAGMSALTDQINEAVMQVQANTLTNQTDAIIGVRYDFAKDKALKFQYDRIRYQDSDSLIDPGLSTTPAETRGYKPMNLYSIVLDFVF